MRSMDMDRQIKHGGRRKGSGRKSLNKKQIATRISPETIDKLQEFCEQTGLVQAVVIENAINDYILLNKVKSFYKIVSHKADKKQKQSQ